MSRFIGSESKPVQGAAVYFEFTDPYSRVMQVICTPDGYAEDGQLVTARLMYRTISKTHPRRQWRIYPIWGIVEDKALDDSELESRIKGQMRNFFNNATTAWTLTKEPFFVEVSKADLTSVHASKTPAKILYRIGQVRTALGFPEMA